MSEDLINDEKLVPDGATVVLGPYGFVNLQTKSATDLDVVNAAKVSFAKQSEFEYRNVAGELATSAELDDFEFEDKFDPDDEGLTPVLKPEDEAVLRYLLANKHGTPFEHTFFKFHVRAPIFVFREWHRHRIGISINEESARYSQLEPHFYIPPVGAWREQTGKPGKYTFKQIPEKKAEELRARLELDYNRAYEEYESMINEGVAREIARAILPVGIYSQMIWSCNARSLMNFLTLRNAPTAQREIRMYAGAMETVFAEAMPVTHDAYINNGRVAP